MNLYGRLAVTILETMRQPKVESIFEKTYISFRVLPHDCDLNFHLTNSRYLAFCDLARVHNLIRLNVMKPCLKRGWLPVVDAQEIRYFRGIKPFETFTIRSQFVGWDDRYLYFIQEFIVSTKIVAVAHVRGGMLCKEGIVLPKVLAQALFDNIEPPALPSVLDKWKAILDETKERARMEPIAP